MSQYIQREVERVLSQLKGNGGAGSSGSVNNVDTMNNESPLTSLDRFYAFSTFGELERADTWIMDSGASSHICCNIKLMHDIKTLATPQSIYLPNGAMQQIFETGTVHLARGITLTEVFFVPTFTHNLISTYQLTSALKVRCVFLPSHCLIQRMDNDHILCMGKSVGRLYVLTQNSAMHQVNAIPQKNDPKFLEWHIKLGHASFQTLQNIPEVKGLCSSEAKEHLAACDICHKAK